MTRILKATRAAEHPDSVVFACDGGHLALALFAAARMRRVEPDAPFDVTICMPDISVVPEKHRRGPIRFCEIDFSALPDVPMVKDWISNATYFRWCLPSAFAGEYRTIFYADTDTYLTHPGIEKLFSGITAPVPLSAALEFFPVTAANADGHQKDMAKVRDLGGANGEYYNAGVYVCQPEAFLAMDGLNRFVAAARENVRFLPIHRDQDQGAMNLAFANDILPLNPRYNWRARAWLNTREVERYDPYVLHFVGPRKPWNDPDDRFLAKFSGEYHAFMAAEDFALKTTPVENSVAWRKAYPKHRVHLFETIRTMLYRRRFQKSLRTIQDANLDVKFDWMDQKIREAVIG